MGVVPVTQQYAAAQSDTRFSGSPLVHRQRRFRLGPSRKEVGRVVTGVCRLSDGALETSKDGKLANSMTLLFFDLSEDNDVTEKDPLILALCGVFSPRREKSLFVKGTKKKRKKKRSGDLR
ncbi:hypothetical protein HYFRA_00010251 [Hymenoscyphus fraxineus]|uniref:Uncharacterized protein n=1 Tax=Hymenoscyphus fraxineus TaxID=746836 RepID=A0A9N9KTS3_9HELO|nr:hypothetical protein HYFRA_00010251 [Hymenoscyphus fraxineus]